MNWKRGFFRLAIVAAIFVLPPAGLYGWFVTEQSREITQVPDTRIINRLPDARIISRSAIPTVPPNIWVYEAATLGVLGLVLAGSLWWGVAGFRRK